MIYQMKVSFDETNWYQLEWTDIDFKQVSEVGESCKDISDLEYELSNINRNSNLKYEFLGERKEKKITLKETKKTRKRK